jgi:hypothetical protein
MSSSGRFPGLCKRVDKFNSNEFHESEKGYSRNVRRLARQVVRLSVLR